MEADDADINSRPECVNESRSSVAHYYQNYLSA